MRSSACTPVLRSTSSLASVTFFMFRSESDGFLICRDGRGPALLHVVDLAHAQQRLHAGVEVHFFARVRHLLHVLQRAVQVVVPEFNRSLLVVDLLPWHPVEARSVAPLEPRHLF